METVIEVRVEAVLSTSNLQPHLATWTRQKTHRYSLRTPGRRPAGRQKRPWTKNQSGRMDGSASANEVEAEKGNVSRSGGLVTGPPPHVSLVIANEIRSETVIVIVVGNGTVLGSESETGIGLLVVVVGTAVRAVPAAEVEAAGMVEATATGRWPREWDFKVFAHMGPQ